MSLSLIWDWAELVTSIATPCGVIKNLGNSKLLCTTKNNTNYQIDALASLNNVCPSLKRLLESAIEMLESNTEMIPFIAAEQLELQSYADLKKAQDSKHVLEHTRSTLTDSHLFKVSIDGHLYQYLVSSDCSYVRKHPYSPDLLKILRELAKYNQMVFDSHQDTTADLLRIWQVKHKEDFCEHVSDMINMLGGADFNDRVRQYILKDIGMQG